MNGAPRRKNVYVRRGINTPVPEQTTPAVKVQAVITNIRNVNAPVVLIGTRRAECVFATARIGARSTKTAPAWDINSKAVRNYQSNVRLILTMFIV